MCSRPQFTDLAYMGGTGPCGPMTIIFSSVMKSWYTSLTTKFGVYRAFHVLKTRVIPFSYMGGPEPCGPMTIIFGSAIRILHIKFGANRSFHVPQIPVYRFGLYGRYQILWTDIAHIQYQPAYG